MSKISMIWDSSLVEKAVLAVSDALALDVQQRFHRERDAAYDVCGPEDRDAAFDRLHRAWFVSLGLAQPVERALRELPLLTSRVAECRIAPAATRAQEQADLFDRGTPAAPVTRELTLETGAPSPALVALVRLRPESFVDVDRLLQILRHEFRHLADMVDPAFGYRRTLPTSDLGPAYERVLRDRYRTVWDATIDGRLAANGLASRGVRERRCADFARVLPGRQDDLQERFARWFDEPHPTHEAIVDFVLRPGGGSAAGADAGRCPVCRFPTARTDVDAGRLSEALVGRIRVDRPSWRPADGLCLQCEDLYRARVEDRPAGTEIQGARTQSLP